MKIYITIIILFIHQISHADIITVDGNVCTLGDAIQATNTDMTTVGGCVDSATGADTILLDSVYTATTADLSRSTLVKGSYAALPDITSEITIQAGTETLIERDSSFECILPDQADEFRLLQVFNSGHLTLQGVTLKNGCSNAGGAVLVVEGDITSVNTTFANNQTHANIPGNNTLSGAAVLIDDINSSASFTDSIFSQNNAIAQLNTNAQGGALKILKANDLLIENTHFLQNVANGFLGNFGYGGAIYIDEVQTVQINNSRFSVNQAKGNNRARAGAIYFDNNSIELTMTNTIFENNNVESITSNVQGGAVYIKASSALLSNLIFNSNNAYAGIGSIAEGGAVYLITTASFTNVLFEENQALGGEGGDAYGGALNGTASLNQVTFTENFAEGGSSGTGNGGRAIGGAIFACEISATNVTLTYNGADGGNSNNGTGGNAIGGGIYSECAPSRLSHMTIVNNTVKAGNGNINPGSALGGGLSIYDPINIDNSIIQNNNTINGMVTAASDCDDNAYITSLGYNHIGDIGSCVFNTVGDQTGMDALLYPLIDNGCKDLLPDGTCLPTHAIDFNSSALDQGSCVASGINIDARGKNRHSDNPGISNADDGCDVGAYELATILMFKDGFENN